MTPPTTKSFNKRTIRIKELFGVVIATLLLVSISTHLVAQTQAPQDRRNPSPHQELDGGFFKIKIPPGFERDPVDEPGIYKWKKNSGEIYIVVGDSFVPATDSMIHTLRKNAQKDSKIEEAKILKLKGGKGLLFKEKGSTKSNGLRIWRLIVFTNQKMLNVDFTAPIKDFPSLAPAFEEALRSLKLLSQS